MYIKSPLKNVRAGAKAYLVSDKSSKSQFPKSLDEIHLFGDFKKRFIVIT